MNCTYTKLEVTDPEGKVTKFSTWVYCKDGENDWPRNLPTELSNQILKNVQGGEWEGYTWKTAGEAIMTFTLGKGDGMYAGSRHYKQYADGDPRNNPIEDKSYDRHGFCRNRPMRPGDVGWDAPDEH